MGSVEALVVNTVRRGHGQIAGMGAIDLTAVADSLTGGAVTDTKAQLDRLEIALKVSIVASVVAGVVGLMVFFRK